MPNQQRRNRHDIAPEDHGKAQYGQGRDGLPPRDPRRRAAHDETGEEREGCRDGGEDDESPLAHQGPCEGDEQKACPKGAEDGPHGVGGIDAPHDDTSVRALRRDRCDRGQGEREARTPEACGR